MSKSRTDNGLTLTLLRDAESMQTGSTLTFSAVSLAHFARWNAAFGRLVPVPIKRAVIVLGRPT